MKLPRVLFVLPAKGGSGGANSVVQESVGLARLGVPVGIAVNGRNLAAFRENYPGLVAANVPVESYGGPGELVTAIRKGYEVVVATTNASVGDVAAALKALGREAPKAAYYVQDYEPLFYEPDTEQWQTAFESYGLIPGAALFAKTQWLCETVYRNHGVKVTRVAPSIDHGQFFPDLSGEREGIAILAMLRPQTPRRAPHRTVRILTRLADELGDRATITVFGADDEQLELAHVSLPPGVRNLGRLISNDVPALMRRSDLFLDLSDFQAFGRTGLEGMACGCVPLVPVLGGASEYAVDGHNALVVDTRSDEAIMAAVRRFADLSDRDRDELRLAGLATAARYSVARTALDELQLFQRLTG